MKKESAKRGYMTSEEIESHLRGKEPYEREIYLDRILKRENLLSAKTRREVYDKLFKSYISQGQDGNTDYQTKNLAKKMGKQGLKYMTNLFHRVINDENVDPSFCREVAEWIEEMDIAEGKKCLPPLMEAYARKNIFDEAEVISGSIPDGREKLIDIYIRDGKWSPAEFLGKKLVHHTLMFDNERRQNLIRKLIRIYEKQGKTAEAEKERESFKRDYGRDLSSRLSSIIAISGILGGIFFLSPNITGNAIENLSLDGSNFLGALMLVAGLIAGFYFISGRYSSSIDDDARYDEKPEIDGKKSRSSRSTLVSALRNLNKARTLYEKGHFDEVQEVSERVVRDLRRAGEYHRANQVYEYLDDPEKAIKAIKEKK